MDKFLEILRLLLPRFYNRITIYLVGIGSSLLSKPIWLELLNYVLAQVNPNHKDIQLGITEDFDWLIGLIIILIALIFNVTNRIIDLEQNRIQRKKYAHQRIRARSRHNQRELWPSLLLLMKDNEKVFKNVGPNSSLRYTEELRTDLTLWFKYREEVIAPNNQTLKTLITLNKEEFNDLEDELASKMIRHIDAFETHLHNLDFDYTNFQFPLDFFQHAEEKCFELSSSSRNLNKQLKWLSKRLNNDSLFMFGSNVLMPDYSLDVDIVIIDDIQSGEKFDKLKRDFKLKFGKPLHVTVFKQAEYGEYQEFIDMNQFKLNTYG